MQKIQGWVEQGNTKVSVGGLLSSTLVQKSYPLSTVSVFISGTVTLAQIYSDDTGTPLSNPFTADVVGNWGFFAPNGTYDVTFSGTGISVPFTLYSLSAGIGQGGVPSYTEAALPTVISQDAGNLARVIDGHGGLWMNSGVQWVKQSPYVNVMDYPFNAKGDGLTDDTAGIELALASIDSFGGGTLYLPAGIYRVTAELTGPDNSLLQGENRAVSKILKDFNGDLITLGSSSGIKDLWIDGNQSGGSTGRAVVVSGGFNQYVERSRIDNCDSYCIEYTTAHAGSGGYIADCELGNRNYPYISVKLPNDGGSASPRCMTNCRGGGSVLIDFNGCDDFFMDNCFTDSLVWTGGANTSTNVMINNCRIAQGNSDPITISGSQTRLEGNVFAAPLVFDANSNNCILNDLVPDWNITDNGSHNSFFQRQVSYTPTWTQPSGTQPSLGNGTIQAVYSREGARIDVVILLTMGTTTTFGNNLSAYRFSLPYAANNSGFIMRQIGMAYIQDSSAGGSLVVLPVDLGAGLNYVTILDTAGGSVRSDSPIVFAVGDTIRLTISYLVD